ncbi:MAG: J domain-containing protein, partial [Nitriliruptor sp.]
MTEPTLTGPPDPTDALRVLKLAPGADEPAIKRAYRRLAREHHPDVGGDVATFQELQLAFEVLLGTGAPAPPAPPGRPSRDRDAW